MTRSWLVVPLGWALAVGTAAPSARAQCGAPPSGCRQCHEADHRGTFVPTELWHADHSFGDFCVDCHGGSRAARDEAAAHVGLVDPLGPTSAKCGTCHEDHPDMLTKYAAVAVPAEPPGPGGSPGAASGAPRPALRDRPSPTAVPAHHPNNLAFSALVGGTGVLGTLYVLINERRRRDQRGQRSQSVSAGSEWSPYVAGGLLGVVVAVSMAIFGHRLSGGGAYQELAAPIGRILTPRSVYWQHVISGAAHWDVPVLVGAILGSFIAAVTGGHFRIRTMPDSQWSDAFGASVRRRWFVAFVGAALTEFAAGVAGGCTASLAVSGGAALAPGAFAFMGGMFAAGIPTAWLIYRKAHS